MSDLDKAALAVLLSDAPETEKERKLAALRREADRLHGCACPECGGRDIEDNGASRMSERSYLCSSCGHLWDAVEV